jgi:hypothetical protein
MISLCKNTFLAPSLFLVCVPTVNAALHEFEAGVQKGSWYHDINSDLTYDSRDLAEEGEAIEKAILAERGLTKYFKFIH